MERPPEHPRSPSAGLERLLEGNRRFAERKSAHAYVQEALSDNLLEGQRPFATIFGCADSRVPVELVFDQGLGDIFVIRNAGHIVGESVLGSMEFAVTQLDCRLIMVLGHTRCGAVSAAVKAWESRTYPDGHLSSIVRSIEPVVQTTDISDTDAVMRAHVVDSVRTIQRMSEVIATRVHQGELLLAAAEYDLATQRVRVLTPS